MSVQSFIFCSPLQRVLRDGGISFLFILAYRDPRTVLELSGCFVKVNEETSEMLVALTRNGLTILVRQLNRLVWRNSVDG